MCYLLLCRTPRKLFQPHVTAPPWCASLSYPSCVCCYCNQLVEFALNAHAEDMILGNYSFCHNLSVLATDHLGNKRLEMGKLGFARKWPWQCLQCLYITAICNYVLQQKNKYTLCWHDIPIWFIFFIWTPTWQMCTQKFMGTIWSESM